MKHILIAGGTGFIGRCLLQSFRQRGDTVRILSRKGGDLSYEDEAALLSALEETDVLINLAGKSVDCRYNRKNRQAILSSRLDTTNRLGGAIGRCRRPPALWINASTATIYRHAEDRPMTEADGETGAGFSVEVARQWENTFFSYQREGLRQVALRMAIVLGRGGGVMQPLERMVRFRMGGPQGKGRQMFSWIHIHDLYRMILFLVERQDLQGVFNAAAPGAVTNKALMQALRRSMGISWGLPAPRWLLEIGALLIRTETELVLKSRWVYPQRFLEAGFSFEYPALAPAIGSILS